MMTCGVKLLGVPESPQARQIDDRLPKLYCWGWARITRILATFSLGFFTLPLPGHATSKPASTPRPAPQQKPFDFLDWRVGS
jgi:hypothetical protein